MNDVSFEQAPAGERGYPLAYKWSWYWDSAKAQKKQAKGYFDKMVPLGTYETIQDFWRFFNNIDYTLKKMKKPPRKFNLRMFKHDIKPMWEDARNENGGKWVIQCPQMFRVTCDVWKEILVGAIGQNLLQKSLCGCVLTGRWDRNEIHIWVDSPPEDPEDHSWIDSFRSRLPLIDDLQIHYQAHAESMQRAMPNKGRTAGYLLGNCYTFGRGEKGEEEDPALNIETGNDGIAAADVSSPPAKQTNGLHAEPDVSADSEDEVSRDRSPSVIDQLMAEAADGKSDGEAAEVEVTDSVSVQKPVESAPAKKEEAAPEAEEATDASEETEETNEDKKKFKSIVPCNKGLTCEKNNCWLMHPTENGASPGNKGGDGEEDIDDLESEYESGDDGSEYDYDSGDERRNSSRSVCTRHGQCVIS